MMSLHGPMAVMSALADSRGLQTVVLCTPEGAQKITLDENGVPVEHGDMPAQGVNCPFCLTVAGVVLALPDNTDFAFAPTGKDLFETAPETIPTTDRRPDDLNCLDPPYTA